MQIVPLRRPRGFFTIVDDADVEWAAALRLRYRLRKRVGNPRDTVAAVAAGRQWLHTLVLERAGVAMAGLVSDHRNGWGLDNRRENLRAMTLTQVKRLYAGPRRGIDASATGFTVWHLGKNIGKFPTREEALAVKIAADRTDGFVEFEDRAELLRPVIEFLEACVADGRLKRHTHGAPMIEDRYRFR